MINEYVLRKAPGTINSRGVLRLLNNAETDRLDVMLREAVQNSWDARIDKNGSIRFGIRGYNFAEKEYNTLKKILNSGEKGRDTLKKIDGNLFCIELADRGTTGLTGTSDYLHEPEKPSNFRKFVFETGQDIDPGPNKSGGTYGYGKASFFAISRIGMICAYTKIRLGNCDETRFIMIRMNPDEDPGRYWWGEVAQTSGGRQAAGGIGPVTDSEADALALGLGMTGFSSGEYGTDILIFSPINDSDKGNDDHSDRVTEISRQEFEELAASVTKWFWPKFLDRDNPDIKFSIKFKNETLKIPDPDNTYPYYHFAEAYRNYKKGINGITPEEGELYQIRCERPAVNLGTLSLVTVRDTGRKSGLENCVAMMRDVEFVVYYRKPSGIYTDEQSGGHKFFMCGVFRTDDDAAPADRKAGDVGRAFRYAENQLYDS